MSIDVNIHVWPEANALCHPLDVLGGVLESVAVPRHEDNGRLVTRFETLKVYDSTFSKTVLDEAVRTNDVSQVLALLSPYDGQNFHYEVASAYDCYQYQHQNTAIEQWIRPLTVNYYGPEYGWKGFEFKSFGPIRLDFSNTNAFRIPHALIDGIKKTAQSGGDTTAGLKMLAKLSRNFDAVTSLSKRIIARLHPAHVLICSNLEVHPLTAHAIYHGNWYDYLKDLKRIAALHEYGGNYLSDVTPDDPAFREARKTQPDYGYLRGLEGKPASEEFINALDPMVKCVLQKPTSVLSRDQIEECLQSLSSTDFEVLNEGCYLSGTDAPFAYLDEPYFKLYKIICVRNGQ